MASKIGELFVALGIKTDQKALNNINSSMSKLRKSTTGVSLAFIGAVASIDGFVRGGSKTALSLAHIEDQTGLNIQKLEEYARALRIVGGAESIEEARQVFAKLQKQITQIRFSGEGKAFFDTLGVNIGEFDSAFDLFEKLRIARQKAVAQGQVGLFTHFLEQASIDPKVIQLLEKTKNLQDKLGRGRFLSDSQRTDLEEAGRLYRQLGLDILELRNQIGAEFAPNFINFLNSISNWTKENGQVITDTISGLSTVAGAVAKAFGTIVKVGQYPYKIFNQALDERAVNLYRRANTPLDPHNIRSLENKTGRQVIITNNVNYSSTAKTSKEDEENMSKIISNASRQNNGL